MNHKNEAGKTALMYSAQNPDSQIFGVLAGSSLKYKRNTHFNLEDNSGKNLLHYAAINGNTDVISYIRSLDINIPLDKKDQSGNSPLDYALEFNNKIFANELKSFILLLWM